MAVLRGYPVLIALAFLVAIPFAAPAQERTPGLYDRPVLALDPGFHTAPIKRADVDAAGRIAVTGSYDRTIRVWAVEDGELLRTIRVPQGPGNIGQIYAVAIDPDGEIIAAGGRTRISQDDLQEQIYLFDTMSGAMIHRIEGIPNVVLHLAFSPDGRRLAATLGGATGLRLYDRDRDWAEIARDTDYYGDSYGAAFAPDERLATTSWDGKLRLYDASGNLLRAVPTGVGQPYGVAFSPDGSELAVGSVAVGLEEGTKVLIFDGHILASLPPPDLSGIYTGIFNHGDLGQVAWSTDGATLFAGGTYEEYADSQVFAWKDGGAGPRRALPAEISTIMTLAPLPSGDLLVASADPWLGRLAPDGTPRWSHAPVQMDARAQHATLAVSDDGAVVDFGYEYGGKRPARFDVTALNLTFYPPEDGRTTVPEQAALDIQDWIETYRRDRPTLDGSPLLLGPYEPSRSLAIHPDRDRFLLGTEWYLRAFDTAGKALWYREVPGIAWAVNISGDGRLGVAAYGDGTIRWHRMEDGAELLALFPFNDGTGRWVVWTPEGYFASSPGAAEVLGWHVNRGWDKAADFFPITTFKGFYEPEAVKLVLEAGETPRALGIAKQHRDRLLVQEVVDSPAPPGPQLHVLTIGVSAYKNHEHLTLDFADDDARDLAEALIDQEGALYAKVNFQHLVDEDATRQGIIDALTTLDKQMQAGQQDVAVIHFSGHGVDLDGAYFLLPHDVDASTESRIDGTGIDIGQVRRMLARMGDKGKVLVLLDACHSGAVIAGEKGALPPDVETVRAALAQAGNGVIVLSSSTGQETSQEDPDWENGAFTEAVLEAIRGRADADRDNWVSVSELEAYVVERVRELTGAKQNPRITVIGEYHYHAPLFRSVL